MKSDNIERTYYDDAELRDRLALKLFPIAVERFLDGKTGTERRCAMASEMWALIDAIIETRSE